MNIPPYRVVTLCEICGNAYGGCSWSKWRVQEPVAGWDAVRREGDVGWTVLGCPQFELEERYRPYYERFLRERVDIRQAKAEPRPEAYRLTEAEQEVVRQGYQVGHSDAQIARETGLPAKVVRRWRERQCLPSNNDRQTIDKELMALYRQGLEDGEIALRAKLPVEAVVAWRSRHRLKCAASPTKRHLARLALYHQGHTDQEIAEAEGVSAAAIRSWRVGAGLEPNHKPSLEDERRLALYHQGRTDQEIAAVVGISAGGIRSWRDRWGLESHARRKKTAPGETTPEAAGRTSAHKQDSYSIDGPAAEVKPG